MKYLRLFSTGILVLMVCCVGIAFGQTPEVSDSTMVLPPGCSVRPNLVYKEIGNWKGLLDLYLPADTTKPVPLVILFHGGGWNHGKKEDVRKGALPYLKFGWAVANVEYRLLGVAPAPAALEDARCALLWLVQNSETYKLKPDKIIPTGTSAGAHLALMIGMLPDSNLFDKDCVNGKKFTIAAIINKYGVTDVTAWLSRTHWLDAIPNKEAFAKTLSPVNYVRAGLPPIITIHGDADPTVPYEQGVRLHNLLDSAHVRNIFYTVHEGGHGKFDKDENKKIGEQIKQFLIEIGLLDSKE